MNATGGVLSAMNTTVFQWLLAEMKRDFSLFGFGGMPQMTVVSSMNQHVFYPKLLKKGDMFVEGNVVEFFHDSSLVVYLHIFAYIYISNIYVKQKKDIQSKKKMFAPF